MKNIGIDQTRPVWLATCKERERNEGWVKGVEKKPENGRFVVRTSVGPTRSKGDIILRLFREGMYLPIVHDVRSLPHL
jgi:hypothetical protein